MKMKQTTTKQMYTVLKASEMVHAADRPELPEIKMIADLLAIIEHMSTPENEPVLTVSPAGPGRVQIDGTSITIPEAAATPEFLAALTDTQKTADRYFAGKPALDALTDLSLGDDAYEAAVDLLIGESLDTHLALIVLAAPGMVLQRFTIKATGKKIARIVHMSDDHEFTEQKNLADLTEVTFQTLLAGYVELVADLTNENLAIYRLTKNGRVAAEMVADVASDTPDVFTK